MNFDSTFGAIFKFLVRVVGIFWVLGGLVGILDSIFQLGERWGALIASIFFLVAGIGLIVVKPGDSQRT